MLLGLSTGHAIGLGLIAAAFVVFSLLCALVIPKRWPQFPGERGLRWFIVVTVVLCIGTLAAVEVFAKEAEEEALRLTPEANDLRARLAQAAARKKLGPSG